MGLLDKLRRAADGASDVQPAPSAEGPAPTPSATARAGDPEETPARDPRPAASWSEGERYDPTQPGQTAVSGIDLSTFAVVSRRLARRAPEEHGALLASYGHTPESWNAVNTAWMARLCQMPFLHATYDAAYRSDPG